jgi:hypothetical protein
MAKLVMHEEISGSVVMIKQERLHVVCPACGQEVEAVANDGRVIGYCANVKQYVNFPIEKHR